MSNYIQNIFADYTENNNLINAEIGNINLFKKTNKLQIDVISGKQITLAEIESFEKYLTKRFKVKQARVDIKYMENTQIENNIQDEWNNIINYIAKKEPFSRAILKGSHIEIEAQKLKVKLAMKGADFLLSKKFDKGLEHLLLNIYNFTYKVTFEDEENNNYIEKFENIKKEQEQKMLQKVEEQAQKEELENQLSQEKEIESQVQAEKEANIQTEEPEEITPLIVGRNMNIKTPLIKIVDISEGIDKVCLERRNRKVWETKRYQK